MPNYVDALGDAVRGAIRAFHGSPYDLDAFDAAKIGTGEGNQKYGRGHNFASAEDTAKHYKNLRPGELTSNEYQELIANTKKMREITELLHQLPQTDPQALAMSEEWSRLQGRRNWLETRPGRMYEVLIGHPQQSLLDWDAPMSQQPQAVRKAFGDMARDMPGDGRRVYEDIATRLGEGFDDDLSGVRAHSAAAEELLQEGIPGIRYLDRNSRIGGKGTRNYVMFPGTEDSIRILRKYGIGGAAAGAAMSDEEQY